jgi:hypothetical protein
MKNTDLFQIFISTDASLQHWFWLVAQPCQCEFMAFWQVFLRISSKTNHQNPHVADQHYED